MSREDAYRLVQRNAMPVWEGKGIFLDLLKADAEVVLDDATLESLFDLSYHVKHVDTIFKRVFGKAEYLPESPRWSNFALSGLSSTATDTGEITDVKAPPHI